MSQGRREQQGQCEKLRVEWVGTTPLGGAGWVPHPWVVRGGVLSTGPCGDSALFPQTCPRC